MTQHPAIIVLPTPNKGLGVYAKFPIAKDDIIEICPVIIIPKKDIKAIDNTIFYEYYFVWDKLKENACIALGYGSIYNHSFKPNAEVITDLEHESITFKCIKDIDAGEEICIDYCGGVKNRKQLWFEVLD